MGVEKRHSDDAANKYIQVELLTQNALPSYVPAIHHMIPGP